MPLEKVFNWLAAPNRPTFLAYVIGGGVVAFAAILSAVAAVAILSAIGAHH